MENLRIIKKVLVAPSKFVQSDHATHACFSYNYKQYGAFENWDLAWSKLKELPPNENIFHELILSTSKVKPYLDIEWFQEKFDYPPDLVLMTIKEKIKLVFKDDWDTDLKYSEIFVASCHRKKSEGYKYSFRIVISTHPHTVVFRNANYATYFARRVIKEIKPAGFSEEIIDLSPYKRTQNIRFVGHSKAGEFVPMTKMNSGDNDLDFLITNISPHDKVLDVPEQKDGLYKHIKNKDDTIEPENIPEIVEKIKTFHPTAKLERIDANGFMQFNYTDRSEPCFCDPSRKHDKIGFFAFAFKKDLLCIACHSGNCVDADNKKIIKTIGSISARKHTTYEEVGYDETDFRIDVAYVKNCVFDGNFGMSNLFQKMYLEPRRIKWTTEGKAGTSYFWNGCLWKEDDHSFLERLVACNIVKVLRDYIVKVTDNTECPEEAAIKTANGHIKRLHEGPSIGNILKFVKPLILDAQFEKIKDIHPYLMSVRNGVIDLKTGLLRACVPEDNMTKRLDIIYDNSARTDEFDTFVRQITSSETGEDLDLYNYLKWALGYAMQGAPVKKMFFILYGEKGYNGKSMILNTIKGILGYYAVAMDKSVVVNGPSKSGGAHSSELCQLENVRAGILSETKEDEIINDAQIKMLTGITDRISVREIYGKQKEILPTLVAFISSNHKLKINLKDAAMYERLALIPFRLSFLENPSPDRPWERKGDNGLSDKFDKNKEGILKWLVEASLYYHQNPNLKPPAVATAAKQEYRKEMDDYANFIGKHFDITNNRTDKIKVSDVFQLYKAYHEEYLRTTTNRFDRKKSERIINDYFGAPVNNKYMGVKMKEDEPESDTENEID
jgi:P4 family phage/plasmid primase-like protien